MARRYIWIRKDVKRGSGVIIKKVRIPDKGKPGLTPEKEKWAKFEGKLHGWRKKSSDAERRGAVLRSMRAEGVNTTKRKLIQLSNITTDKPTERLARQDFEWLRRRYPPK